MVDNVGYLFFCFCRGQDIESKKHHVPVVDRTPLEPPPILVAVVGPPKVGKSLLIQCLIKNFTRQPFSNIKGPVTVVSGRTTFTFPFNCFSGFFVHVDVHRSPFSLVHG